jgi:hypothetical protein
MNYNKIQEILQGDSKFAPLAANRDVKVVVRGGECSYSALTVRVAQEMAARGIEDKSFQKTIILAIAATLSSGGDVLPKTPAPPIACPPPQPVKKPVEDKAERVTVKPTQSYTPSAPVKQTMQQQAKLDKFVERGDILKYQSAVAITQLLASIFQLADNDTWPGNEKRKALLNELLLSYEDISKTHVNLSVRQILRAQIESQITATPGR